MTGAEARHLYTHTKWGYTRYYQDVPELGLTKSLRNNEQRLRDLRMERIDFRDKVVWDVGCAGGFFLRYALDRGARRAIGFDSPPIIMATTAVNACLGYSVELHAVDLKSYDFAGVPDPDVVLFLSMLVHVPVPDKVMAAPVVVLEDNDRRSKTRPGWLGKRWSRNFPYIEYVGRGTDRTFYARALTKEAGTTIYHMRKVHA